MNRVGLLCSTALLLAACTPDPATAETVLESSEAEALVEPVDFPKIDHPHRDSEVGQTGLNLQTLARNIEAMPAEQRAVVQNQARFLAENCPYSRAGVAAGFALDDLFARHRTVTATLDADDPLRLRIEDLAFGLEQHASVHRLAGLESLPSPEAQSYLAHQADYLDPIPHGGSEDTIPSISGVKASLPDIVVLVDAMDPSVKGQISEANEALDPLIGDLPLKPEMITWRGEMQTLQTQLEAAPCAGEEVCTQRQAFAHQIGHAIAMLDDYLSLYC